MQRILFVTRCAFRPRAVRSAAGGFMFPTTDAAARSGHARESVLMKVPPILVVVVSSCLTTQCGPSQPGAPSVPIRPSGSPVAQSAISPAPTRCDESQEYVLASRSCSAPCASTERRDMQSGRCASAPPSSGPSPEPAGAILGPPPEGCPEGTIAIPPGRFFMGTNAFPDEWLGGPRPVHLVTLSGFCIDRTEVTVREFEACVQAGACSEAVPHAEVPGCNSGASDRSEHPANCVDWVQAQAYCTWRGGGLPTEAEWEYAARGVDGRIHIWGDSEPPTELCWTRDALTATTCVSGSRRQDTSPFGVVDMAGNVAEWTGDWWTPQYDTRIGLDPRGSTSGEDRVLRGSPFTGPVTRLVAAARLNANPSTAAEGFGVRCVHRL